MTLQGESAATRPGIELGGGQARGGAPGRPWRGGSGEIRGR